MYVNVEAIQTANLDLGAVPSNSTINTSNLFIVSMSVFMMGLKQDRQVVIRKVELPGVSSVNANKTINANDNVFHEDFALAA